MLFLCLITDDVQPIRPPPLLQNALVHFNILLTLCWIFNKQFYKLRQFPDTNMPLCWIVT